MPIDETIVYTWSQTKSGWTGLFIFVAMVVIGAALSAVGGWALAAQGIYINTGLAVGGAAIGWLGGLIASGFSPTTSVTARFSPYVHSTYNLAAPPPGDATQAGALSGTEMVPIVRTVLGLK